MPHNDATRDALAQLLADHGLTPETRLYREALREALEPGTIPGFHQLAANPAPSESIVDVYGQGHIVQAEQVGPGLAFAESDRPDWQETMEMRAFHARRDPGESGTVDRVEVQVLLQDILSQGGLIYPVESVTIERAWYCTLPAGSVTVREVA